MTPSSTVLRASTELQVGGEMARRITIHQHAIGQLRVNDILRGHWTRRWVSMMDMCQAGYYSAPSTMIDTYRFIQ